MDGHLRDFSLIVAGLYEPKFTDYQCIAQRQVDVSLTSQNDALLFSKTTTAMRSFLLIARHHINPETLTDL
jgi:hypothetical protein